VQALTHDEDVLTSEAIRRLLYRRDVALARHRAAIARSLGITDVEMLALVHLAERRELAPSAIATLLDLSSGGATALVQRLERAGHVTRQPHPTDRRSILIRLSPRTAERLEEAEAPLTRGLESVTTTLTDAEQLVVTEVLAHLASLSEELEASLRREAEAPPDALSRPVPSLWA
jgi:DNA-binding MarR family transcriptional regulator